MRESQLPQCHIFIFPLRFSLQLTILGFRTRVLASNPQRHAHPRVHQPFLPAHCGHARHRVPCWPHRECSGHRSRWLDSNQLDEGKAKTRPVNLRPKKIHKV